MSNSFSVSLWCSQTYRAALEAVVAPLAPALACRIETFDAQDDAALLRDRIAGLAERPAIVFYSDLGDILHQNLGHLPEANAGENRPRVVAALEDWIAANDALAALFYRHRKTVTLVPALALVRTPAAVQALLRDRFAPEATLPPKDDPGETGRLLPDDLDPKFALMASAILQTAPAARASLGQLEAIGTPLDGVELEAFHGGAALDGLIEATGRQAEIEAIEARHDLALRRQGAAHETDMQALRHRLDSVQAQLLDAIAVQEDLSHLAAQKAAAHDIQQADHRDEIERLTREAAEAAARHMAEAKAQADGIARLTRRLSEADARHIAQTDEIDRLSQESAEAAARHMAEAKAQADDIARLTRRLSEADARHIAQTDEIDRLGRQGAELRDQLRDQVGAFDLVRTREQNIRAGLEQKIAQHTKSIMALSGDLAARDIRIAQALDDLQGARAEVEDLRNSTSWRITGPLRRVVLGLRRVRGRRLGH